MKTVNLSYDVYTIEHDQKMIGETCMDISMADDVADDVINDRQTEDILQKIETIITNNEALKGRTYITGSIKDAREASRTHQGGKDMNDLRAAVNRYNEKGRGITTAKLAEDEDGWIQLTIIEPWKPGIGEVVKFLRRSDREINFEIQGLEQRLEDDQPYIKRYSRMKEEGR